MCVLFNILPALDVTVPLAIDQRLDRKDPARVICARPSDNQDSCRCEPNDPMPFAPMTEIGPRHGDETRRGGPFESLEVRTLLSSGQLDTTFGFEGALPIIGAPIEQIVSDRGRPADHRGRVFDVAI